MSGSEAESGAESEAESGAESGAEPPPPADLGHAGAVVDKAIEYLLSQNISQLAIASALLGGALGLLARSVSDEAIVQILNSALASVRTGELRQMSGNKPEA
jgi:hypothetical protein